MVFLGLERPVEYGRQQIFDPTTAQMVLQAQDQYANALYRDYVRGLEDMKEFNKEYGDFMTPFGADQEWYNNNVIDKVRGTIQRMYEAGIDPTRSVQGRAAISRLINSVDVGTVNAMRANAKLGYAYQDTLRQLAAKGRSSQALEDYIATLPGNVAFNDFATVGPGGQLNTWNRMPTEYSTLQEFVHPSFANLKPHLLTADEAKTRVGSAYDPTAEYTGITKADMERSMRSALPGLVGSPMYGFYKEQARKQLQAMGIADPSEELVNEQFVQNAITADSQMMTPLSKSKSDYFNEQQLAISRRKLANDERKIKLLEEKAKAAAEEKENNRFTRRQIVNIMNNGRKQLELPKGAINGVTINDRDMFARNYSAYQVSDLTQEDLVTARALLSAGTSPENISQLEKTKRSPVTFTPNSGLNFTQHRQYVYGGRSLSNGSISNRLLKYLQKKHVKGYLENQDDISINHMYYSDNAAVWDINGYVRILKTDLDGFKKEEKNGEKALNSALSAIGAVHGTRKKYTGSKNGNAKYIDEEYYDIPISRTIDSRGYTDSSIDKLHDQLNYGKSVSSKRQHQYEEEDEAEMYD